MKKRIKPSDNKRPTGTERVKALIPAAGSISGGAAGGAIGVLVGGPIGGAIGGGTGSLISLLAELPAAKRHRVRIELALAELHEQLSEQEEKLQKISDEQFKVIGECVQALNATVDAEKIKYLQSIASNSVEYGDYSSYESILLSRVIRDISVEEIHFLVENFSYETINIYSWHDSNDQSEEKAEELAKLRGRISEENGLLLLPDDPETLVANGLVSLGVLAPEQLSLGVYKYKYSDIAVKMIVLLRRSD